VIAALRKVAGAHADLALIALMIGILCILFVPIPTALLDLLLIANLCFALLVLLITFYTLKPVEFSTFPSLLLIATLFRPASPNWCAATTSGSAPSNSRGQD